MNIHQTAFILFQLYGLTTLNEPKSKGVAGECIHKLLLYMVVSVSAELKNTGML